MVWHSLQFFFSQTCLPATTWSLSFSAWVRAPTCLWVSTVSQRKMAREMAVPPRNMKNALRFVKNIATFRNCRVIPFHALTPLFRFITAGRTPGGLGMAQFPECSREYAPLGRKAITSLTLCQSVSYTHLRAHETRHDLV